MKNPMKRLFVSIVLVSLLFCAPALAEIVDSGTCGTGVS